LPFRSAPTRRRHIAKRRTAIDRRGDFVFESHKRLNLTARREPDVVEGREIARSRDSHLQHLADLLQRHRAMFAGDSFGQRLNRGRADRESVQTRGRDAKLDAQGAEHFISRRKPEVNQHLTQPSARCPLLFDRQRELFGRDQVALQQHFAQSGRGSR
jgi:hypothetical protein